MLAGTAVTTNSTQQRRGHLTRCGQVSFTGHDTIKTSADLCPGSTIYTADFRHGYPSDGHSRAVNLATSGDTSSLLGRGHDLFIPRFDPCRAVVFHSIGTRKSGKTLHVRHTWQWPDTCWTRRRLSPRSEVRLGEQIQSKMTKSFDQDSNSPEVARRKDMHKHVEHNWRQLVPESGSGLYLTRNTQTDTWLHTYRIVLCHLWVWSDAASDDGHRRSGFVNGLSTWIGVAWTLYPTLSFPQANRMGMGQNGDI